MSLKAQLTEDMKNRDACQRSNCFKHHPSHQCRHQAIRSGRAHQADDGKVIAIITKMVKQRKDSANIYAEAGRQDLADKENAEIEILHRYLPQMMSAEEIRTAVEP